MVAAFLDSTTSAVLVFLAGLLVVIGLAALLLHWRDRAAAAQGKTEEQVRARFAAILQFHSTLRRCIPGVLTIILGVFYAVDRSRQRESDWWFGIALIPVGWVMILLLARKSWRRYRALQQRADQSLYEIFIEQFTK